MIVKTLVHVRINTEKDITQSTGLSLICAFLTYYRNVIRITTFILFLLKTESGELPIDEEQGVFFSFGFLEADVSSPIQLQFKNKDLEVVYEFEVE